jgi:hypothetical protein
MLDIRRGGGSHEEWRPKIKRIGGGLCGRPRARLDCYARLMMMNFEFPATALMQDNLLSFACRGVAKVVWWRVILITGYYWISCGREGISNEHSKVIKNVEFSGVDKSTFSCWASRFTGYEKGQAEFVYVYCKGWPMTAVARTLLQCVDELIWNDQWITATRFETEFTVSGGRMNNIIDTLGYSKACAYWVRQSLVNYDTTVRKEKCSEFLSCYIADGESC